MPNLTPRPSALSARPREGGIDDEPGRHQAGPRAAATVTVGLVLGATAAVAAWRSTLAGTDLAIVLIYALALAATAGFTVHVVVRRSLDRHRSSADARARLAEREHRLDQIVSSLHEGLLFQDRDLRIVEFNDAAARMLGLSRRFVGITPQEIATWQPLHPDGSPMDVHDHPVSVALTTGQPTRGSVVGVSLERGPTIWIEADTEPVFDEDGQIEGVISRFRDVTTSRSDGYPRLDMVSRSGSATWTGQELDDPLTGLANRGRVVERLTAALQHSRQGRSMVAVLSIDLDRFNNVNDSMGHEMGDAVLVEVAARLRTCVRSHDVVARLGGDEFMILADLLTDPDQALELAEKVRAAVARPVALPVGTVTLTASIGIAFASDDQLAATVLRDAGTALHKAKEGGRDQIAVFDDSQRAEAIHRAAAEQILRRALDEGGLRVHYQPIVDLTTGTTTGVEALLRIEGPGGDLLAPAAFIKIAEESGLIIPIGAGVLDDACRQLSLWRQALGPRAPHTVSVNLSARQLVSQQFPSMVRSVLERYGLEPAALTLELTETTLIEAGHEAFDRVEELHELGVRLAIDDFGTGYSSLAYLKRFPVDTVKIDRSFIVGLASSAQDVEIVRAVISLGRSLDLEIVAEGVETVDQMTALQDLGCHSAQGYLFARPAPSDEIGAAIDAISALVAGDGRAPRSHLRLACE